MYTKATCYQGITNDKPVAIVEPCVMAEDADEDIDEAVGEAGQLPQMVALPRGPQWITSYRTE